MKSLAKTPAEVLVLALQDLHDAEIAWGERFPAISGHIRDPNLMRFAGRQIEWSEVQAARLEDIALLLDVPASEAENIWLRCILDGAARDTETIAEGVLLDIALVGAMRKGIQAERVSYETAITLTCTIGNAEARNLLVLSRDEEASADDELVGLLERLAVVPTGE